MTWTEASRKLERIGIYGITGIDHLEEFIQYELEGRLEKLARQVMKEYYGF